SSHEVALGYQEDTEDPSVYIKFKVTGKASADLPDDKPVYLLAWTTTPWTLPGNTALAVAPDAEYAVLKGNEDYLVMAAKLVETVEPEGYQTVKKVEGKELVGTRYEPLYRVTIAYYKDLEKPAYRVIEGDFVTMEDGTGIVHIAPAYGEMDFIVGEKEGLPLVHTVDLDGKVKTTIPVAFTPEVRKRIRTELSTSGFPEGITPTSISKILSGENSLINVQGMNNLLLPGAGKFVKDADPLIIEDLKARGLLLKSGKVRHTYPFCWRCDAPLLYYAKQTWYIRTTAVKDAMLSGNNEINWYPEHIKNGRFGDWLKNNIDWAFARERYWGSPLPIWRCEKCGAFECVGSVTELKNKPGFNGFKQPLDLHRPYMDDVSFNCGKCGGRMKRTPEVMDCWFDSGSMPFAQLHYPVENRQLFDESMKQADFICEGVDQTRGWFYSLHAISTLLFKRPVFKNCICLELVLDAEGKKMSKSRGNVVDPVKVVEQHGADALRWYCFTSAPPGMVRRFDTKMVADITRQLLLILWNVYSFFVMYANIDKYTPAEGEFPPAEAELDRWILSELNQLIIDVTTALDGYNPTEAGRKIDDFVDGLSNWYVRRSRRRFWKSENDADKLSAYNTLYTCLVTLAKLMAPFTPFLAEELYQNLVRPAFPNAPESIHLADFPVPDESKIDKQLADDNRLAMKVCSMGRAARSKAGIKVRQPLETLFIGVSSDWEKRAMERLQPLIIEELNVKTIDYETVERVVGLDMSGFASVKEGNSSVAISTEITMELEAEGFAREIVHRVQTMRRTAGYEIADHIVLYYEGAAHFVQSISAFADYIRQETLAVDIDEGIPDDADAQETFKIGGASLKLGVKKAK
ncbi:MAG: isoleucine--tRNA ligase, partial [Dehalococcoidales bacterium]